MNEQKMQYLKSNYKIFGVGSIIYGILYATLMYKNPEAITFPIIIALTLAICMYVLKKFKRPIKKTSYFFIAVIQLLAIAVCLTENQKIIVYNKVAIFLLLFIFMMEQMYDTKGWQVGKSIGKLFMRMINIFVYYGKPWSHLFSFCMGREEHKNKNRKYIAIGIGVSIPLVLLICGLLANADRGFAVLFEWIFENILSVDAILILFITILVYSLMYSFICSSVTTEEAITMNSNKLPNVVAITFTAIIAAIYIGFCVLQVSYLFNGYSDGVNYAQFAREGFFELLFVSALNLIIVVFCLELFEKSKVLDVVLIIISACTYILIGSSAYRMILYVEAYNLTFLRVFVLWFLAVLVIWMTGAIIYIKKKNWNYFKFSICVIAVMYLIFVYVNPDRIIIKYNIENTEKLTQEDVDYFCLELEPKVVLPEIESMQEKFAPEEMDAIEIIIARYQENIVRNKKEMTIREINFAKKRVYNEAKEVVGDSKELEKYEIDIDEELYNGKIYHDGETYYQFGFANDAMRGIEIGAINEKNKIYSVKGRNPKEWIFSHEESLMDDGSGWFYKTKEADTPDELAVFKSYSYEE